LVLRVESVASQMIDPGRRVQERRTRLPARLALNLSIMYAINAHIVDPSFWHRGQSVK